MKAKISLILIFLALSVQAAEIKLIPVNTNDYFVVQGQPAQYEWKCTWFIFCHKVEKLGATITTINATDTLKDSRAVINTNFTNLNTDKIEVATTSIGNITTLSNLSSIGTLTTGVWQATAIGVGYGGSGTTSPAQYQVILGNGAYGFTIASSTGSSGQFFTSNGAGAYPSWQTSSVALGDDYIWTGNHFFKGQATTSGPTLLHSVTVGSTTLGMPSYFAVSSSTYFGSGVGIGKPTTTPNNLEVAGDILLFGELFHKFYQKNSIATSSSAAVALSTTDDGGTNAIATCPVGYWVISGGVEIFPDTGSHAIVASWPSASTTWTGRVECNRSGGSCGASQFMRTYAICIKP